MATRMYVCESAEHSSGLLSGLNDQRMKGLLCDVTVRVQGNIFKAHVNVLASTMGYFRDLFFKSGKKKVDNDIEIPMIVNTTGFAKILDFVYTSQLCLSQSTVMQVLCSACYLQIPYVVEKCQEFITTHGHVTSPASLSEVTGPLLQNLQKGLSGSSLLSNQNASAGLSFLSHLNRLSERSRGRSGPNSKLTSSTSPQNLHDSDEQQECALINTPPSPADRASANRDICVTSAANDNEEAMKSAGMVTLKRERDTATPSNGTTHDGMSRSPNDRYLNASNGIDDGPNSKKFSYNNGVNMPLDLATYPFADRDNIDHKSLAEYFSTDREAEVSQSSANSALMAFYPAGAGHKTNHIALTSSKSLLKDRILENGITSQSFSVRKEKPKKEYRCEYCDKTFGRQQHLKRHILTHTGERPYPCTYCEKRFRRSEHLKHHLASHEGRMGNDAAGSRKKPRKPTRGDDAYSLSKMMLNQMGNIFCSSPVVLPGMCTGVEGRTKDNSDEQSAAITEIEEPTTTAVTGNVDSKFLSNENPVRSHVDNEQSTAMALNLTTIALKGNEQIGDLVKTEPGLEESANQDAPEAHYDDASGDQNSTTSGPQLSPDNNMNIMFDEGIADPDLSGMASSEVVTNDFKRLIAAMDE